MPSGNGGTTSLPDALFDDYLARLPGSELRVLLYASRLCYRDRRDGMADGPVADISLSWFAHGRRTNDGRVIDHGTGLSRTSIIKAVTALDQQGLLHKTARRNQAGYDLTSTYRVTLVAMPEDSVSPAWRYVATHNYPNVLVDEWLPRLSDAELRVLCYIMRRTRGFHKNRDQIERDQLLHGIIRKDGRRLDHGCGVGTRALYPAIKGLKSYGLIYTRPQQDALRGNVATEYGLVPGAWGDSVIDDDTGALSCADDPFGVDSRVVEGGDGGCASAPAGGVTGAQSGMHSAHTGACVSCAEGGRIDTPRGVQSTHPASVHDVYPQDREIQAKKRQVKKEDITRQQRAPHPHVAVVGDIKNTNAWRPPDRRDEDTAARAALQAYGVQGESLLRDLSVDPAEVSLQIARLSEVMGRHPVHNPAGWLVAAIRGRFRTEGNADLVATPEPFRPEPETTPIALEQPPARHTPSEAVVRTADTPEATAWAAVCDAVRGEMAPDTYAYWITPLVALALVDGRLVVGVAESLTLPLVERRVGGRLTQAARRTLGNISIELVASGRSP